MTPEKLQKHKQHCDMHNCETCKQKAPLPKGFSFQVNGGRYGGFYVNKGAASWRVCLGWVAITLFFFDIEPVMHNALRSAPSYSRRKANYEPFRN